MTLTRRVEETSTFIAQLVRKGLGSEDLTAMKALISRTRLGHRVVRFNFVTWNRQPAGIYQSQWYGPGLRKYSLRYFDFGVGNPAILISLDEHQDQYWRKLPKATIAGLLELAQTAYHKLCTVRA